MFQDLGKVVAGDTDGGTAYVVCEYDEGSPLIA
jgi:hypothetical protein